jgi:hypothetical protein
VLVIGGVNHGTSASGLDTATFTPTCDWFDPATNGFSTAPSTLVASAFFGASILGDGRLLTTGGLATSALFGSTEAVASATAALFDGTAWSFVGIFVSLPAAVAFHTQETLPDGRALIAGGLTGNITSMVGSSAASIFDATTLFTPVAPIGTGAGSGAVHTPRGAHSMTRMWDGTYLVLGGTNGSSLVPSDQWALKTGTVYAP